jgi:hypothetical protein
MYQYFKQVLLVIVSAFSIVFIVSTTRFGVSWQEDILLILVVGSLIFSGFILLYSNLRE